MNNYSDIRPLLKTGDILLCVAKDNDIMAAGIRVVTDSKYSHAAIVRRDYGRVIAFEATGNGVNDDPLSFWHPRRYHKISVYRSDDVDVALMLEYMLKYKGCGYAFGQIGTIWWNVVFPKFAIIEDANKSRVICSEFASGALCNGGVDPSSKEDYFTFPGDLAKTPLLNHVLDFVI